MNPITVLALSGGDQEAEERQGSRTFSKINMFNTLRMLTPLIKLVLVETKEVRLR